MSRSLGTLTLDLIARTGGFEAGMDKAKRTADRKAREIEREMKARAQAIDEAFDKMAKGLAAAFAGVQIVSLVKGTADLADQLSKLSQRTGVAVKDLSALNYAAGLNDATLDDLEQGLKGLSNKMLEAASGSGESAAAFKALGVTVTDSAGKLRPVEQVLLDIADKFAAMEDGAGKAALANKLMEDSGVKLIPTLNNGRDGLASMRKEAEQLGAVIDDDLAKQSAALNDNLARMHSLTQGVAAVVGNAVIPAINELANEFLAARKAGLSFMEAIAGIGLSDLTKSPAEHIKRITDEIEHLREVQSKPWYQRSLMDNVADPEKQIALLEKQRKYWELVKQAQIDASNPPSVSPSPKIAAPALPSTPARPKAPKVEADPLADAARAYGAALDALTKQQRDAETSGAALTASQRTLLDVMTSSEWLQMPETWREAVAQQGEYAIAAEQAAAEQAKLNALLAATPSAQLEQQRETMQFLAQAFEQGRISAEQFNEAANAALGNVPNAGEVAKQSFLDLSTVANDAARTMAGAFTTFFDGQDKNVGEMLATFLEATAKMIAQAMILKAVQAGMGYFGFADGGAFDSGGTQYFARGGVVDQPTFFKFASGGSFQNGVMGEAGPEAIMPLKRGPDGKLGVIASGGGSGDVNVSIVVNENGRSEQASGGSPQRGRELARQIEAVVTELIIRNMRPGGLLYR